MMATAVTPNSINADFNDMKHDRKHEIVLCGRIAMIIACWYGFSAATNSLGKKLLLQFHHPITLVFSQQIVVVLSLSILMKVMHVFRDQGCSKYQFKRFILPLAIGRLVLALSTQVSIWKTSIPYAHTIKALQPIFTVVITRFWLGKRHSTPVYLSLVVIVTGVLITTATDMSFDIIGVTAAVTSALVMSSQNIYTKRVMKDQFNHYNLLYYTAITSLIILTPIWISSDGYYFLQYDTSHQENTQWVIIMCLLNGLCNFGQTIMALTMLSLVTPLSYSIMNSSKRLVVIIVALLIFNNPWTPLNIIGMVIASIGLFWYNQLMLSKKSNASQGQLPSYVLSTRASWSDDVSKASFAKNDSDYGLVNDIRTA